MATYNIWVNSLWVGLGGFIGTILRYWLSIATYSVLRESVFPYATLLINMLGSLAIGFLIVIATHYPWFNPQLRLFVIIGLLGGFTTFSAFSLQTLELAQQGQIISAGLNILLQVGLGLFAVWMGYWLGKNILIS